MKHLTGAALPPKQEGPKTGEIKIRVERLVLQHDKLEEERFADFCATEVLWWGEEQGSTSGHETPSTPTSSRGVVVYQYPIRTTRKLMGDYLELMSSNWGGLRVKVLIPASVSGRKHHSIVGEAEILLDTLTSRSPINGWFAVSDGQTITATGDPVVIGKVKVSIHIHYYNTREMEEAVVEPTIHDHLHAGGRSASGGRTHSHTPEKKKKKKTKVTHGDATAAATAHTTAAASSLKQPHEASDLRVIGATTAASSATTDSTAVGGHGQLPPHQRHQHYLEDILLRGQQLRNQMLGSMHPQHHLHQLGTNSSSLQYPLAHGGGDDNNGSPIRQQQPQPRHLHNHNHSGESVPSPLPHTIKEVMYTIQGKLDARQTAVEQSNRAVVAGGHQHGCSNNDSRSGEDGNPPEVSLFYPQPFIGDRIKDSRHELYDDDDDDLLSSSTDDSQESDDDDDGSDSQDELARLRSRQAHQLEPLKSYHGMHRCVVRLTGLSFSRVVTEVRFKLRVSDDVTFVQPLAELVSPILELPWTGAIEFVLCLASYTNKSKVVLEVHEIRSQYDPIKEANILLTEKLVGIAVVGCFAQQQDFLGFHDPVQGGDPVRCSLAVGLDPVSTDVDRQVFLAAAATVAAEQLQRKAEDVDGRVPKAVAERQRQEAATVAEAQVEASAQEEKEQQRLAAAAARREQLGLNKSVGKKMTVGANGMGRKVGGRGLPAGLVKSPGQSTAGSSQQNTLRAATRPPPPTTPPTVTPVVPLVAKPSSLFVLEVTVECAKGLPRVEAHDSDIPELPSTFIAIEDVFVNLLQSSPSQTLASVSPNIMMGRSGGSRNNSVGKQPVGGGGGGSSSVPLASWRSTGDRSDIILNTTNPRYNFTADIDVPSLEEQLGGDPALPCDTPLKALKCLDKLTMSLWQHSIPATNPTSSGAADLLGVDSESLSGASPTTTAASHLPVGSSIEEEDGSVKPLTLSTQAITSEVDFWNQSEMLGKISLDLKPLRYNKQEQQYNDGEGGNDVEGGGVIASLDGWYHVFDAQDAVLKTSIGQVKCHVRFVAV